LIIKKLLFILFSLSVIFSNVRKSSAPFISGDSFREYADHIYDETTTSIDLNNIKRGEIIFVKGDKHFLNKFFIRIHPNIKHPYILITHNSDDAAPWRYYSKLDDPMLIAWFGTNIQRKKHRKLHAIPIGIANSHWPHGDIGLFHQKILQSKTQKRDIFCYVNFKIGTHRSRRNVRSYFEAKDWANVSGTVSIERYLDDMTRSRFVISPRGHGLDCHRTWETLMFGAIPVVVKSDLDCLYEDLPVVIVDNWNQVTFEFLNDQYEKIRKKRYSYNKLYFQYWINKIESVRRNYI